MTGVLIRKERDIIQAGGHLETEAGIGVMLLEVKECWEASNTPGAGRGAGQLLPHSHSSGRNRPCQPLVWTPGLQSPEGLVMKSAAVGPWWHCGGQRHPVHPSRRLQSPGRWGTGVCCVSRPHAGGLGRAGGLHAVLRKACPPGPPLPLHPGRHQLHPSSASELTPGPPSQNHSPPL